MLFPRQDLLDTKYNAYTQKQRPTEFRLIS